MGYYDNGRPWAVDEPSPGDIDPVKGCHMMVLPAISGVQTIPCETFVLDVKGVAIGNPHNPSLVVFGDKVLAVVRCVEMEKKTWVTTNVIGAIRGRSFCDVSILSDALPNQKSAVSYEDCRLFVMNGKLGAMATLGPTNPRMAILEIEAAGRGHRISRVCPQASPRFEKNWMPAVVGGPAKEDRLRLVYSTEPLQVIDYDQKSGEVNPSPGKLAVSPGHVRGGSPLIAFRDGWLSVTHQVHRGRLSANYVHRFAVFNEDLTTVKLGVPFRFLEEGVEFCSSLMLAPEGGKYLLGFGFKDKQAMVAEVSTETVETFL